MKKANCITYNAANKGCRFSTIPLLRVSKCGVISFNPVACSKLALEKETGILFHQDKADQRLWAIELSNAPDSFRLRESKGAPGHLFTNTTMVAKLMMSSLNQKGSFSVQVASAPEDSMYELITSPLK
jgi:hypothetical protein